MDYVDNYDDTRQCHYDNYNNNKQNNNYDNNNNNNYYKNKTKPILLSSPSSYMTSPKNYNNKDLYNNRK